MGLKVAIVGLAADSRGGIPFDDPEWEVWGLPWDAEFGVHFHRTFDPHCLRDLEAAYGKRLKAHLDRLRNCARLYMQEAYPEVPNAQRYPLEEVAATVQSDAFASSVSYMMALAIHEGAQEIAIYGVHMEEASEYGYQKPNLLYLIGLARGRGIKVTVPDTSPLMKYANPVGFRHYVGRYGWLG